MAHYYLHTLFFVQYFENSNIQVKMRLKADDFLAKVNLLKVEQNLISTQMPSP